MKRCATCDFEYDDAYDGCPGCARTPQEAIPLPNVGGGKGWRYSAFVLAGLSALLVVTVPLRESVPPTLAGLAAAIAFSTLTDPLWWAAIAFGYAADRKSERRPRALTVVLVGLLSAFLLACVIGIAARPATASIASSPAKSATPGSAATDEYRSGAIANMKLVDAEASKAESVLSEAIALSNKGRWRQGADKLKSAFVSPAYDDSLPKPTELQQYNRELNSSYIMSWFAYDAMARGEGAASAQHYRDLATAALLRGFEARNAFKKKYGY